MALRILSGSLRKVRVIGAGGDFIHSPALIVAARQFVMIGVEPPTTDRLRIDDTVTSDSITISWGGTGPTFSEEIPFMIAGEVADPIKLPIPRPGKGRLRKQRGKPRKR